MTTTAETTEFAKHIKSLGFRVFIAKDANYGIITSETGDRVLSFSFTDGGTLSGNYGPPSQQSGTGWRLAESPYDLVKSCSDLVNADSVKRALNEPAPHWCRKDGNGCRYYTTLAQHLATYGSSSQYREVL